MIATRVKALTSLIEENAALERKIEQSDAFRDTAAALAELKGQLQELLSRYRRVVDRLEPRVQTDLSRTLEEVKTGLHDVGQELKKNPRQGAEIKRLAYRVTAAAKRVNDAWRETTMAQLRLHQKVLELVGSLPEIASRRSAIDATIVRVMALSDSVPADDATLRGFDRDMAWLADVLQEVTGLSVTVREFLQKVVNGQATFVDLNPEIMAWIADRDRAHVFQIHFGQATGQRAP